MFAPPHEIIHDSNVGPALRQLFSEHPAMVQDEPETLSRALYMLRFLSYRPHPFLVEMALETLRVEAEVLS